MLIADERSIITLDEEYHILLVDGEVEVPLIERDFKEEVSEYAWDCKISPEREDKIRRAAFWQEPLNLSGQPEKNVYILYTYLYRHFWK